MASSPPLYLPVPAGTRGGSSKDPVGQGGGREYRDTVQFTVYPQDVYREGLSCFVSTVVLFYSLASEPPRVNGRIVC